MARTTYQDLLDAGVHFGHLTRKWDPKLDLWRCLRPGLSAHTAQALATGRYPLLSLTRGAIIELMI